MNAQLAIAALLLAQVSAQSTISTTDRYAYSANAGWIDFRPSAPDGVRLTETYLSGYAYAANFGWIHFGDGSPNNGYAYSNSSATDYGVNMNDLGQLTGHAYAANVGWIRFEQSQGQPQLDFLTGKLTGHAYGANIGWIALDTASSDLATATLVCPDTDGDGIGDAFEMLHFGNLTTANATTDSDGDGQSDAREHLAGTNPTMAASQLVITSHSYGFGASNTANLTFTSSPNRLYSIEHDTDLQAPWTNSPFGTFSPDAGATTTRSITFPNGPMRFFRVLAHKPLQP